MTAPNPNTAVLLDMLVRKSQQVSLANNAMLAVEEFSLGEPLNSRPLDLCFGCGPIPISQKADLSSLLVLSKGICRVSGVDVNSVTQTNVLTPVIAQGSVNLLAALPTGESLDDVYAWGSVFLTVATPLPSPLVAPTLQTLLVRGGVSNTGAGLFTLRDFDVTTAASWLLSGAVPACAPPVGVTSLEIIRFVLSIDHYLSTSTTNQVSAAIVDVRNPRGWGGFCEEDMATYLIPALVQQTGQVATDTASVASIVYKLVAAWIGLPSWNPSFQGYWQSAATPMPTTLRAYVANTFGIIT